MEARPKRETQAQALCFQIPMVLFRPFGYRAQTQSRHISHDSLFQLFCQLRDFHRWKPNLQSRTFSYRLATDGKVSPDGNVDGMPGPPCRWLPARTLEMKLASSNSSRKKHLEYCDRRLPFSADRR